MGGRKRKQRNTQSGRPKKVSRGFAGGSKAISLSDCSLSTKYRRAHEIADIVENNVEILEIALNIAKRRNSISIDENLEEETDESDLNTSKHTTDSASAFYLELDLKKRSYIALAKDCRLRNCSIYPSYPIISKTLAQCLPSNINISEIKIVVPMQKMFDKTAERLCEAVALDWSTEDLMDLTFTLTVGFDSSSGHKNVHQKCTDAENETEASELSLLVTSFIIIKICSKNSDKVWINPTPQSIRFCRPLRIAFEKETDTTIKAEHHRLKNEIDKLARYKFSTSDGRNVRVAYEVTQTLFDGKCLNAIVGNTATSRCPCCRKSTYQFGQLNVDFTPNSDSLNYGLGLLHAEINTFEHLLNMSYRMQLKTWDIRKHLQEQYNIRKRYVQSKIFENFGVRVDQVLQGHGTTNTGNLARTCFKDPQKFAKALEIDEKLVNCLATIITLFKCKEELKLNELEKFCRDTYEFYYKNYPWCRMNPTVHKLLLHGCQIARILPMPLAYYAEDANESWHKYYRKNMTEHSRQKGRLERITDVFNRAVYMSDPKLSLIYLNERRKLIKKHKFPRDALALKFIKEREIILNEDNDAKGKSITNDNINYSFDISDEEI